MHLVFVMFVVRDVSLALDQFWHPITELNADTIKNVAAAVFEARHSFYVVFVVCDQPKKNGHNWQLLISSSITF